MGTYNGPFTYRDTVDTSEYGNDYESLYNSASANDVFYKFTQTRSTDIYFRLEDAPGDAVVYYVLDEHGNEIYRAHAQENPSYSYYTRECLYLGTYYLVAESSARSLSVPVAEEGLLTVCVEYIPRLPGEDFFYPADLGTFSEDFSRSIDMENFTDFELDYHLTGDYDIDAFRHDVVHRFTLSEPMEVRLDNCGSGHGLGNPYNYQRSVVLSSSLDTVPPENTRYGCYY